MASSIRPGANVEAEAWLRRKLVANRNYWPYWAGNVASWAGLGVADVLLLFLVFQQTGSALAVAYVGIAASLPVLAIGLPAGVIADRYDRRNLLVVTALLQAAVLAAVPLTIAAFGFNLVLVLGLVFALEAVTAVFRPSANAILPTLVHSSTLDDANGLLQASTAVASTVGAASAAFLLVTVGTYPSFAISVGVFLLSGLLLTRIGVPRAGPAMWPASPVRPSLLADVRIALEYLRAHTALLELTLVSIGLGFFLAISTPFLVVYTVDALGQPANAFGYLVAGFSGGFFVGSITMGRLGVLRHFGWVLVGALWTGGALFGVLVLVPSFEVAGPDLVMLGLVFGLLTTAFFSLVQRIVPTGLLGRYLSIDETVGLAMTPLGILAGGLLIDWQGVWLAYAVAAVGLLATGLVAMGLSDLRSMKYDAPPEPVAVPRTAILGTRADELPGELPGRDAAPQPAPIGDEVRP
ncbi:MAG: MFS transporter [Thermoplasmata archaeon]